MIIIKTIIIVATRTKLVMLASLIFSCTLGTFYTALETLNRERETGNENSSHKHHSTDY